MTLGAPLPFPLYDNKSRMQLAAGMVLEDQAMLTRLLARGVLRPLVARSLADETGASERRGTSNEATQQVPFPELRRPVEALHAVLRIDNKLVTCPTGFVGVLDRVSVITTIPLLGVQPYPLREREDAELRLFTGKGVYAWHAEVLKVTMHPAPHVYWHWVDTVETVSVRRHQRVTVDLPAMLEQGATIAAVRITDLSFGGARLRLPTPTVTATTVGATGRLRFELALEGERCAVDCAIEIRNRQDGVDRVHIGVAFAALPAAERLAIAGAIAQASLERRRVLCDAQVLSVFPRPACRASRATLSARIGGSECSVWPTLPLPTETLLSQGRLSVLPAPRHRPAGSIAPVAQLCSPSHAGPFDGTGVGL